MREDPARLSASIGRRIDEVDTPVPILDLDVFESNARHISSFLAANGVNWRPHVKAHKSPTLARLMIANGAMGVTCAKTGEAEVMVDAGITEVLVANHLGNAQKWERIADLQRSARVLVCVDDREHIRLASEAGSRAGVEIPLLIELDIGMRRVGAVSLGAARELARLVAAAPGVRLLGVMGYEGQLLEVWPQELKTQQCRQAIGILTRAADALRAEGHTIEIVSAGGTGTFATTGQVPGITEIEAGGGCMMDLFYSDRCHVPLPYGLTLIATVVSVQTSGQIVIDAGNKALGQGTFYPPPRAFDDSGLVVRALSAEHGMLEHVGEVRDVRVGDRVRLIAGYSDAMLVMHDHVLGVRDGRVVDVIELAARGRLT